MKIIICGSIDATYKIKEIADELEKSGHETEIPLTSQKILGGELTMEEFQKEKAANGDGAIRKIQDDVIKRYFRLISGGDAVLVVNESKKGINNYIGGNVLMELAFAHVLEKRKFLLNCIPEVGHKAEIVAMQPTVINGDLSKI